MELPHLGEYCSETDCRRLSFLPVKCDGCNKIFCGDHYKYTLHNCPAAYKKNVQVPVCPLCSAPVPGKLDELPDIRVSQHIDNDCKSDTAKTRRDKVYTNRCTFQGCKKKEMIPILCEACNLNFCLRHRHAQDHACTKKSAGKAGQAALARYKQSSNSFSSQISSATTSVTNGISRAMGFRPTTIQGNMSEDEAMKLALQASLSENSSYPSIPVGPNLNSSQLSQEQEDFLLAKAIEESEREATTAAGASNPNPRGRRSHPNCEIS